MKTGQKIDLWRMPEIVRRYAVHLSQDSEKFEAYTSTTAAGESDRDYLWPPEE